MFQEIGLSSPKHHQDGLLLSTLINANLLLLTSLLSENEEEQDCVWLRWELVPCDKLGYDPMCMGHLQDDKGEYQYASVCN